LSSDVEEEEVESDLVRMLKNTKGPKAPKRRVLEELSSDVEESSEDEFESNLERLLKKNKKTMGPVGTPAPVKPSTPAPVAPSTPAPVKAPKRRVLSELSSDVEESSEDEFESNLERLLKKNKKTMGPVGTPAPVKPSTPAPVAPSTPAPVKAPKRRVLSELSSDVE
jgi:hypothetical protein